MIKNILGTNDLIEFLRGKRATFLLAISNTKTADIEGITQAGIPGKIYLTPTLDSEFLTCGEVRSLESIAETPKGVPTPALLTRATHLLKPFSNIEVLNLGVQVLPKIDYFKTHDFSIAPSEDISTGANIDAMDVFKKGLDFGQEFECKDDYIILAESVPSGTTTAATTALALGYECKEMFSSSFKNVPNDIRNETIEKALSNIKESDDIFARLSKVSDNMLIFVAGFLLGLNNQTKVILAGGTQMACALLIVNSVLKQMEGHLETSNLALCTTKWVYEDEKSDIKALLELNDLKVSAYYADFDFSLSEHPALKLYDEGEAKEGVGAGGALTYALLNGISKEELTQKVESFLG
ncbi:nicotinate mononucleotide-dependent phosphoribosyltransferase CobT [Halarcobacter bivalviorum]|uniref:Nicotinate-nucleotide--dimethylbenzimidazole phosphoribosyltransferase n=1 Tax=Halarcobacter bivalviorum TaxID=663364 RepID=A0AAX2AD44_9BACT|nr:TIGR00303 family protein [Halarcobacter bivalviorum]AXH12412.1 nicotinate-nucleotide--dimethylbenzimidazole phosphoribosyltransferase [Halarcobacter bivalviorum]RXK10661.1 TIGR00303 family protein [Halarcobacter bivalviorum]